MKDITEFHEEPVFNEMFSLLRNFLTPYVDIATKNSSALPQVYGLKKSHNDSGGCSHKNRNSTRKQEDFVQVWFMMKLPKNKTMHRNVEYLLEHFFDELVHDFEGETAPTSTLKTNSSSEKTTLETTLDYHSMPSESDSTLTTTQTVAEVEETDKIDDESTLRVWNVLEGNTKRKRSVFKPNELINTVPFLKQLNNPLRAKRIKRDIQYISAPLETAQLNTTSAKEFDDAPPKTQTDDEVIVNITNAEDFDDDETENDNQVVVGDFGNTFLHAVQTQRKKLAVNGEHKENAAVKENVKQQQGYSSAVKQSFCDALVVLLVVFAALI